MPPSPPANEPKQAGPRLRPPAAASWLIAILLLLLVVVASQWYAEDHVEIDYTFFHRQLEARNVKSLEIQGQLAYGEFIEPPPLPAAAAQPKPEAPTDQLEKTAQRLPKKFVVHLLNADGPDAELRQELLDAGVQVSSQPPRNYTELLLLIWLGLLVFLIFGGWSLARRARDQMLGGGMLPGVLRSPARRYSSDAQRVTFNDVAGLGNVKSDLQEIVDYLRDPARFQRLGARVPKGVLLMGPPGTGKTLLAKAVAGEAGVPFFSINGSEFIQLFVGVGAGRVRDLFQTAQANSPSILFIDEVDAIGRQRGAGLGGGHDEREQTLNQILSEMDGFSPASTVIVLAATNRPDVLDPALLRPGRFDRHITVDRPTLAGRRELFEVHSRGVPVADDVDFERLARATVGMTGADIRNLVNEAALWATRNNQNTVRMSDFEYARDKVLMGPAREDILTEEEKEITAYHEAGHAILAWLTPGCDRVHKVSIMPRGRALGVTQLVPEEERYNISQQDLEARLSMMLGGRAAEKSQFDQYSAGAENDLREATRIARRMVTHWGMSDRLGPVAYHMSEEHPFLGREIAQHERQFSEHTAQVIDEEVAKILHAAEDRAKRTLDENADKLNALAEALLEREVLDEREIGELIGPSVYQPAADTRSAGAAQVASVRK
jgi:cell division protease FtsH